MNRCSIANAITEMSRVMEGLPLRRAYMSTVEEDGSDGEEEVPLGTEGAEVWDTVETRWHLGDDAEIEWIISERDEAFETRRKAAVKAAKEIAGLMLRGDTFVEAKKKVLDRTMGIWEGDLPGGWSSSSEIPWWLI